MNKIYEVKNKGEKEMNHSLSHTTIIYKSSTGLKTSKPTISDKSYIIQICSRDEETSDEVVLRQDEIIHRPDIFVNQYDLIYNEDQNKYNIFYLTIKCDNIYVVGLDTCDIHEYKGITIKFNINLFNLLNQSFVVYSKHIKEPQSIVLKNNEPVYFHDYELVYYPLYILCQEKFNIEDFVMIYPYLVKNIFKFNL